MWSRFCFETTKTTFIWLYCCLFDGECRQRANNRKILWAEWTGYCRAKSLADRRPYVLHFSASNCAPHSSDRNHFVCKTIRLCAFLICPLDFDIALSLCMCARERFSHSVEQSNLSSGSFHECHKFCSLANGKRRIFLCFVWRTSGHSTIQELSSCGFPFRSRIVARFVCWAGRLRFASFELWPQSLAGRNRSETRNRQFARFLFRIGIFLHSHNRLFWAVFLLLLLLLWLVAVWWFWFYLSRATSQRDQLPCN